MASTQHIDGELLEKYSMQTASERECAAVEEHLLTCAGCRAALTETDRYVGGMRAACSAVRKKPPRFAWLAGAFRGGRPVWALSFAVALMLLMGLQWQWKRARIEGRAVVALAAMRGPHERTGVAPAGRLLRLALDGTGLPLREGYRAQVVGTDGASVFEGAVNLGGSQLTVDIPAQRPGLYFVRLYSAARELAREYALTVVR